jgi:DNA-binding response OmpR family regulator
MKKILLVDDAKVFLEVERALFLRTGAQIYTATTGAEALRLALNEKPDIILLDLVLPDITGDKVCMQIKTAPATSGIPIIMVTTISREEEMERCRRAGCDDYVTKPINYTEMLAKVAQILRIPHRVSRRVLVRMEINTDKETHVLYGSSVDLSISGMLIECTHVLRVGDPMVVRFFLPGRSEILARGRIVRSQSAELRKFRYGFQFEELADADREAISLLVRSESHPQ